MSRSLRIRRTRWCREKKSASPSQRRVRENLKSDGLGENGFAFNKTYAVGFGWGTLWRAVADVRLCRGSALFAAIRAGSHGLQGNTGELETRAAGRSDPKGKMVGDLSGPATQRARRENQHFESEPESGAGAVCSGACHRSVQSCGSLSNCHRWGLR